jgi:hypothetical protein
LEYRQILNGIGFQALNKRIDIPNTELGIDEGEDLRNQLLKIQYQERKQFLVLSNPSSYEQWQVDGHAEPINEENFQKDFWIGDAKGGI